MSSIRSIAREYLEDARDGMQYIAVWKEGRSWNAELILVDDMPEDDKPVFDSDYIGYIQDIVSKDPNAVLLCGYFHNLGGEETSVDNLAGWFRYHYENHTFLAKYYIEEEAPVEDQPEEVEEETHTTGYDSYVSQFPPKPEYTREVISQWGKPFYTWAEEHGGDTDKAVRGTKLLDSVGTSETIPTKDGGFIEAMWDNNAGVIVILLIPPDQAEVYRKYQAPLPLWAY